MGSKRPSSSKWGSALAVTLNWPWMYYRIFQLLTLHAIVSPCNHWKQCLTQILTSPLLSSKAISSSLIPKVMRARTFQIHQSWYPIFPLSWACKYTGRKKNQCIQPPIHSHLKTCTFQYVQKNNKQKTNKKQNKTAKQTKHNKTKTNKKTNKSVFPFYPKKLHVFLG